MHTRELNCVVYLGGHSVQLISCSTRNSRFWVSGWDGCRCVDHGLCVALTQLERCWEEEVSHKVGRYHDYITRIRLLRFVILELAFAFISIPRRVKKRPHSSIEGN